MPTQNRYQQVSAALRSVSAWNYKDVLASVAGIVEEIGARLDRLDAAVPKKKSAALRRDKRRRK